MEIRIKALCDIDGIKNIEEGSICIVTGACDETNQVYLQKEHATDAYSISYDTYKLFFRQLYEE